MINEKIVIEDKTADYNEAYIETLFLAGVRRTFIWDRSDLRS